MELDHLNMSKVILLVEDNPNDAELTRIAFEKNRITNPLVNARDGVEALDYLFCTGTYADRESTLPAIMILDLKLPRVDGLEVLRRVRANEKTQFLPVVILTSSREQQDMTEAYRLGTNAYVRKPIDFTKFQEAIMILGLFWLQMNEHL